MYTIECDSAPLFDPRFEEYGLQTPMLTLEANRIGTLTFRIFPGNPQYGFITKISSVVTVYRDWEIIFQGRPTYSSRAFRNAMDYKCEEITARMNDYLLRPQTFTGTAEECFDLCLNYYNSRCPSGQKFNRGRVTVTGDEFTESIVDPIGCWEAMQEYLVERFGGYIVPRYENGAVYIDYLREQDLPEAAQPIRFGENMADLFIETDSDDTYSVLIPYGADYDETIIDEHGEEQIVTKHLDITEVNGGLDYIENATAIALYGRKEGWKQWLDIDDAEKLLETAREYLNETAIKFAETVSLQALDLHNADMSIEAFRFLHRVRAESMVHNISETYVSSQMTIPLGNPDTTKMRLGDTHRTLTDRLSTSANQAAKAVIVAQSGASEQSATKAEIQAISQRQTELASEEETSIFILIPGEEGQKNTLKLNDNYVLQLGTIPDVEAKLKTI